MTLSFLDRFRPQRASTAAPVFDGLAQVRAYWEARRDNGLPTRASLDPRGLNGVLDRVFLAERIGRGLLQLRIAGSGLADFAGMDVRGLPLSCLFAPESREQLGQSIERVFDMPAVAELDLGSDRARGDAVLARLVLLPLAEDRGAKLVLGALSFAGPMPTRCKLQLRSWREERLHQTPPEATDAAPQPIRRYGHLSLVHVSE
ncbi:MAG: PAS domain-containing protein [Tabrizicola sp.]